MWISLNAGGLWEGRTTIATTTDVAGQPAVTLDKPVIDVSWYSGTLGYVYVSYIEWHNDDVGQSRVMLRRSTNLTKRCRPTGGGCIDPFEAPVAVASGADAGNLARPQVVVNSTNGNVYVLYISGYTGAIYMKKSTDYGVTFGPQIKISNITRTEHYLNQTSARAFSVPIARYNPVTNKLMVVWHQGETLANDTDLYYTFFDPDTATSSTNFNVKHIVLPYEQWSPSVDNDDSGKALISYYDNNEGAGWGFRQMGLYVDASGNKVTSVSPNPASLNYGGAGLLTPSNVFGEYHDLVFWGTKWRAPIVRSLVSGCTCAADITVVEVQ
ncbi:MAG TPA: hypothetical protein VHW00_13155 [Thermoanaerobaculia bacterium]|nr:hypothetical protein [Thermoanaerobaculia bacterium]